MMRPNSSEIRAEIQRLQYVVRCQNLGTTEQQHAERSLRYAQLLLSDGPLIAVMLADLRHLVRWHDQLGQADMARAEATIARASTPEVFGQQIDAEIAQLRAALIACCDAVGGAVGPDVSTAFLLRVPAEVRAVIAGLRTTVGGQRP